jgi:hypothetical protein
MFLLHIGAREPADAAEISGYFRRTLQVQQAAQQQRSPRFQPESQGSQAAETRE